MCPYGINIICGIANTLIYGQARRRTKAYNACNNVHPSTCVRLESWQSGGKERRGEDINWSLMLSKDPRKVVTGCGKNNKSTVWRVMSSSTCFEFSFRFGCREGLACQSNCCSGTANWCTYCSVSPMWVYSSYLELRLLTTYCLAGCPSTSGNPTCAQIYH